ARRPEKLVVRVDRTDPSKNIVRGFRAFELYLDAHPEMHKRVGMLALIDLSIEDNFLGSVAAYKQFDALFVNAIFDGMNLIAKEAPLVNDRDGVLILSENAGAHPELGEHALTVNPFDLQEQADAIHTALVMPEEERRRRIEGLRAQVREHDITRWVDALMDDLAHARPEAVER